MKQNKKVSFLFCVFTFLSHLDSQSTELAFFGAVDDTSVQKTIFDQNVDSVSRAFKNLDFKIQHLAFGTGQIETGKKIIDGFGKKPLEFTSKNYKEQLQLLIQRVNSGEIKKNGNKLIVVMLTHGSERMQGIRTHSIAVKNSLLSSSNSKPRPEDESMDPFFELAKVAKEKGVQLAILDLTCHSGESIKLQNSSTCVISGSSPDHPSYGAFADLLFSKMKSGVSLEEVYLQARAEDNSPSFPMISTDFGNAADHILYNLVKPYIFYQSEERSSTNLKEKLESQALCTEDCFREENYQRLVDLINVTKKIDSTILSDQDRVELLKELKDYKDFQDQILQDLKFSKYPLLKKTEKIKISVRVNNKVISEEEMVSWREILLSYPESSILYFQEKLAKEKDEEDREREMMNIARFEKIRHRRAEILKNYQELKNIPSVDDRLYQQSERTRQSAYRISGLLNKMYVGFYRSFMAKYPHKKASPCSEFIL